LDDHRGSFNAIPVCHAGVAGTVILVPASSRLDKGHIQLGRSLSALPDANRQKLRQEFCIFWQLFCLFPPHAQQPTLFFHRVPAIARKWWYAVAMPKNVERVKGEPDE
jgi:hypothetical protein